MGKLWADRLCSLAVAAQKRKDDKDAKVLLYATTYPTLGTALVTGSLLFLCGAQELYEKALIADAEHVETLVRFSVLEMKVKSHHCLSTVRCCFRLHGKGGEILLPTVFSNPTQP